MYSSIPNRTASQRQTFRFNCSVLESRSKLAPSCDQPCGIGCQSQRIPGLPEDTAGGRFRWPIFQIGSLPIACKRFMRSNANNKVSKSLRLINVRSAMHTKRTQWRRMRKCVHGAFCPRRTPYSVRILDERMRSMMATSWQLRSLNMQAVPSCDGP